MKKRLIALLLVLVLLTAALPVSAFALTSGTCGENLRWSVSGDVLTISGSGEMYNYHFMSPQRWPKTITEIVIEEGITHIGDYAFINCEDLKAVTIPDSVTSIGGTAFDGCKALKSIALPDGVTTIGNYAFSDCDGLTSIVIPNSVISLGNHVFSNCESLESVTMSHALASIPDHAFAWCGALRSIVIPNSVTSIGGNAFYDCESLTSIVIPDSVTSIGKRAFDGCGALLSIHIPNAVTSIGESAFYNCKALKSVTIPDSVTFIEYATFYGCENLESVTIPDSVTDIDQLAFYGCNALTSITIPNSVTSIDFDTFNGCKALKFITIPASVTEIREDAFAECSSLDTVYYGGTEEQWKKIDIQLGNEALDQAAIVFQGMPTPTPTPEPIENPFTDVQETDWFYEPVLWAVEEGVTGGKTATTFAPNEGCTRAQVVTFLWAANGKPMPESAENPFTDIKESDWYYNAVLWAVEQGITTGISADEFGPEQTCTRAQIVTFLYAAMEKPPVNGSSIFHDVADRDWFAKPVIWAAENDVTGGIGNGKFGPNDTCTRAQVVTFLKKVYQ